MKKTVKRRIINETASMNFSANGDSPQDIISILGKITNLSRPSPVTQDMMPKTGPAMPLVKSLDVVRNAEMDEAPDEIGDLIKSTGADNPSSSNIPTPPSRPPGLGSSDAKPSAPSQDTSKPYKPQGKDDTYNGAPEESLGEIMKLAGMKHDAITDEDEPGAGDAKPIAPGTVPVPDNRSSYEKIAPILAGGKEAPKAPSPLEMGAQGREIAKQAATPAGKAQAQAAGLNGGPTDQAERSPTSATGPKVPDIQAPLGGGAKDERLQPAPTGKVPDIQAPLSGGATDSRREPGLTGQPNAGRGNSPGGPTDQAGRNAAAANTGSSGTPKPEKFSGTIADFQKANPGASVGQAMNAIQGKTAIAGGANDPNSKGFKGAATIGGAAPAVVPKGGAAPAPKAPGAKPAAAPAPKAPGAAPAAPAPAGGAVSNPYGFAAPGSSDDNAANFFRADKAMQADKAATAAAPKAAAPAAAPRATPQAAAPRATPQAAAPRATPQAAAPKAAAPAASKPIPQPPQKPAELRPSAPLNKEVGALNPTAESQYRAMKAEYDQLLSEYTELKRIKNLARGIQQLDERGPSGSAGRGSSGAGVGRTPFSGAGVGRTPFSQTQMPRRIPNNLPNYSRPYYQQSNGSNFMRQLLPGLFAGLGSGIAGGQNNSQNNGGQNNSQNNGGQNNSQNPSNLGDYAITKDKDGNTVLTHKNGTTHTLGPDGKVTTQEPPLNDTDKKYLDAHKAAVDKAAAAQDAMIKSGNGRGDGAEEVKKRNAEQPGLAPAATPAPTATPAAPPVKNVPTVPNPTPLPTGALNPAPIASTPAPAATPPAATPPVAVPTTSTTATPDEVKAAVAPRVAADAEKRANGSFDITTKDNPTGSTAPNNGWGAGESVGEEFENEPNPKYRDVDYMNMMLAGGLDGPKKTYPKVAKGDNPMQQVSERVLRDLASDYMSIKNG